MSRRYCGSCGHANDQQAVFCSKCGHKLAVLEKRRTPPAGSSRPPAPVSERPAVVPPPADPPAHPTIVDATAHGNPAPTSKAAARRRAGHARTMVGMGVPDGDAIEAAKELAKEKREEKLRLAQEEATRAREAAELEARAALDRKSITDVAQEAQARAANEAAEREAKEKLEREAKGLAESEAKERAEREAREAAERAEKEAKEKEERDAEEWLERERAERERLEAEARERERERAEAEADAAAEAESLAPTLAAAPAAEVAEPDAQPSSNMGEDLSKTIEDQASPKRIPGSARTMLGHAGQQTELQAAVNAAREKAEAKPATKDARPEAALDPMTNRTMLGQPAPKVARSDAPPKGADAAKAPAERPSRSSDRPPAHNAKGRTGRAGVIYPQDADELSLLRPPKKKGRGLGIAVLVVGLIVLLGAGSILAYSLLSGGSDVNVSVVHGENGEILRIEVPGAAEGSRARYAGNEQPLVAGVAEFEISADELAVGENECVVEVIGPDGDVESYTQIVEMPFRVRPDLGALQQNPPAVDVVVEAPVGSEVTVNGERLVLDEHGRGTRRIEIDATEASAEGVVEHVVRYRVHPPSGEAAQEELRLRIPLTTLQLERPGVEVVTERDSIEVAGAVTPGARVTVAGESVTVVSGRFLHRLGLPQLGERTVEVVARATGKGARVARIHVRRVESLEAAAETFDVNEDLTYARIAEDPAAYRAQNVEFTGQIYNVDVRGGQNALQVLVDGCAAGVRCPLWVQYPLAADFEDGNRVRILGTVVGEQRFRTARGERTVPRIDATFVLEAPARAGRRR